jgi:hypothetical protein
VFAAGGTPQNFNPADDEDSATANVPGDVCEPVQLIQCPAGYYAVNGACSRNKPLRERRPHVCPPDTFGQWPDCHRPGTPPVEHPCDDGMVTRGHRCVCPGGTHLDDGECVPNQVCPPHTFGRWPHCHRLGTPPVEHPCHDGMVKRGHRCVCPGGTHRDDGQCVSNRKRPNLAEICRRKGEIWRHGHCVSREQGIHCSRGTFRRGHRCVAIMKPHVCPRGTVGRWPRCHQIDLHRPSLQRPIHRPLLRQQQGKIRHGRFALHR